MNLKSMQWGWVAGLLWGVMAAAPGVVHAETDEDHDDASARRTAMAEWYSDDYSQHGKHDGGFNQKEYVFSPKYQRFLAEAATQERLRYSHLMPNTGTSLPVVDALAPIVAAANGAWTNIGPTKANYEQNGGTSLSVSDAGRVNAIVTDPGNTNIIYVGFSGGGVWKSTDGGSTWAAKTETLGSLSVGSLAMDPNNSSTLYLGLGDPFDGTGIGLVKSTNGGTSWGSVVFLGDSSIIPAIQVAPSNSNIVLAATNTGLYRSTNGGSSFSKVSIATGQAVDPFVWTIAWAGGNNFVLSLEANTGASPSTLGQIWYSSDNGASWTQATGVTDALGIGRISVASAPSARTTLYATAAVPNATSSSDLANLFKSTNGGVSWSGIAKSGTTYASYTNTNAESSSVKTLLNGQGWYNHMTLVDPTNPNVAYFGGALLLAKTSDGGSTYKQTTNWLKKYTLPYVHADFHAGHFDSSGTLYVGTDGGIFKSTDGGATFSATLNQGIASHLVYQVGSSLNNRNAVIAGLQDNGTRVRVSNTSVFNQEIGGDGFGCDVNQTNANLMIGSLYYTAPYKSTNGGLDFTEACTGINECDDDVNGAFTTRIIRSPADASGNTLFTFSNVALYKTTNYAGSWSALGTSGLPTSGLFLRQFGIAKSNTSVMGLVANSGRAYLSSNGGSSWTAVPPASLPNNGYSLSSIAFDTTSTSIVYIASVAPDSSATHLWKSTNSGSTWTAIDSAASGFPNGVPVNSLIVDPVTHTTLYAATHLGVYTSANSGSTWTRYGTGMPLVNVTDLYVASDDSLIRAATFGRSVWEFVPTANATPTAAFSFTTSGLTATFTDASTDSDGSIATRAWDFGDGSTSTATNPSHAYTSGGNYNVSLTVTDNGGATNTLVKPVAVTAPSVTVSASVTGNGTVSPSGSVSVTSGTTKTFTVTPNQGNHIVNVTGTCPAGTLSGTSYTTGTITANCSVIANFAVTTFTVTASVTGNGSISPNGDVSVNSGATKTFTVTPTTGNHIVNVTGTCPAGTLSGTSYTTGAISGSCTVIANYAVTTHKIGGSVAGLIGNSVTLSLNSGAQTLQVNVNGPFFFPTQINEGTIYTVSVLAPPTNPVEKCVITSATGTANADVSNIVIACDDIIFQNDFE